MRSIIDKALQAILKMLKKKDERVLVWENASPASSFASQALNIDLSDLTPGKDLVAIEVSMSTVEDAGTALFEGTFIDGKRGIRIGFVHGSSGKAQGYYRSVAFTSNKILTFNNGFTSNPTQDAIDNNKCIPLRIFKIFGGGKLANAVRKCLRGGVCYG